VLMHLAGPGNNPVTDFEVHFYPIPYQPVRDKVLEVIDSRDYGHACEAETSVVLALDSSKVFMDKAGEEYLDGDEDTLWRPRDMKTAAPSGVHGAPRYATSEKGVQILEAMVSRLVEFLEKI
jgi:creatinine amidohydrolase/Fe(II)-dependent formamide hydrolase-like protein